MHDAPDDVEHPSSREPETIADPYVLGPLRGAVPPPAPPAPSPAARKRRSALITAALGFALVLSWGTGIGFLVQRASRPSQPAELAAGSPRPRPSRRAGPSRRAPSPAPRAAGRGFVAPRATTTIERGAITVVDVGVDVSSLADELARQRDAAREAHETMLVMTTVADCAPCASVFEALPDPLLQKALAHVRLVRVAVDVFRDDLDSLQIPNDGVPGFFVLGPDLRPRDGIDGGEWDDDVPENIAPVLGAFVQGTLTKRRTPWQGSPSAGMRL